MFVIMRSFQILRKSAWLIAPVPGGAGMDIKLPCRPAAARDEHLPPSGRNHSGVVGAIGQWGQRKTDALLLGPFFEQHPQSGICRHTSNDRKRRQTGLCECGEGSVY